MNKSKNSILLIEDDLTLNCQYDSSLKDKLLKILPSCSITKFPSGQLSLNALRSSITATSTGTSSSTVSTENSKNKKYDFLIADLNLIDMTAQELVEKIKISNIKIKIILIAEDEIRCVQAREIFKNGERVLSKPLHMSDMIALIDGEWESFQYGDNDDKDDMVPVRIQYLYDEPAYPFDLFISINSEKKLKIFYGKDFVDKKRLNKLSNKGVRFLYAKRSDVLTIKHKMYIPIRTSTLISQEVIPFSIYVDDFSLLFRNSHILSTDDVSRLKKMKITQLFIEDRDEFRYQKYLDIKINKFIEDDKIDIVEKSEVLSNYLNQRVQSIITNPTQNNLQPLIIAQKHFQTFLKRENNSFKAIITVLKSDNQNIYNHSISVATLCYAVTTEILKMRKDSEHHKKIRSLDEMDLESEESLNILFVGALLHDIGKAIMYFKVWAEEVNQHENDDDSNTIPEKYLRMHPQLGYDTLKKINGINPHILEIVLHHEEYCDGTGYPKGLSKNFISNYTQLVTLVNYYDNIMRLSATLKTINKERAIANMEQNINKFNKAYFHAFKTLLIRGNL
ncbi:MAG: HD domain-containing protein [Oligoflexia bacterium]|nr:HD domain-containing protein [Oligoflexia bacterium]